MTVSIALLINREVLLCYTIDTDKSMVHQYIIHHLDTAVLYLMKQAAHHHITVSDHTPYSLSLSSSLAGVTAAM